MAETNTKGAFWGFDVRSRQLAGSWVTAAYVPPPIGIGNGWFAASLSTSNIERITYESDTVTANIRGKLGVHTYKTAATGNSDYGWFAGGLAIPGFGVTSRTQRIEYTADTGTASARGSLSMDRESLAATGNDNYGWFVAGNSPIDGFGSQSRVDRIDYTIDTSVASIRGVLSSRKEQLAATGNANYGWFGGGFPGPLSSVDRIDYAVDTNSPVTRGPLSSARRYLAATGNSSYGWFGGGVISLYTSIVDRIDYVADTTAAVVRGPLSITRGQIGATGNTNYGWFGGGTNGTNLSAVDRIDYAADTNTASARGPLSSAKSGLAATGGFPG
jgi:hypothetical protein